MKECKELISNTGQTNVGMVLDSFHWYCADDKIEDIRSLKPDEITHVDFNDARTGFINVSRRKMARELPMATGVINAKDFLQGLLDIGFDGPLRTEPFNQVLNDMEDSGCKAEYGCFEKALQP